MPQTVTAYLGYARDCAAMADKMSGDDKARLMEVAEAWLKLADDAAKRAGTSRAKLEIDLLRAGMGSAASATAIPAIKKNGAGQGEPS